MCSFNKRSTTAFLLLAQFVMRAAEMAALLTVATSLFDASRRVVQKSVMSLQKRLVTSLAIQSFLGEKYSPSTNQEFETPGVGSPDVFAMMIRSPISNGLKDNIMII